MHAVKKAATTPSGGLGALGELKAEHGFKTGVSGAHTARTILRALLWWQGRPPKNGGPGFIEIRWLVPAFPAHRGVSL